GIIGFNSFKAAMIKKFMAGNSQPPQTVTAMKATVQDWQPQLSAVGTLRAVRGVDVAAEVAGMVTEVPLKSGAEVNKGDVLLRLRDSDEVAKLQQLQATLHLAQLSFERARKQVAVHTIAQADYDAAQTNLEKARADVAAQAALVAKKTIRAPFDGRLGISTVNPGQYVNPGDMIVTLQQLDPIYVDFTLPQQSLGQLAPGLKVTATIDAYPDRRFDGAITAVDPKVDPDTRNVRVEARLANPRHVLVPGMFANASVDAGAARRYLTLPQTAVTFNPYGETVFVAKQQGTDAKGQPRLTAQQTFVTTGPKRGDQVAILKGLNAGDLVVTSGQLKLKNGTPLAIDNRVQPANSPNPTPQEH
ncbi:MAG: efflux RND transporter periplasmic adaptor subunit, partial [Mizugakiibacter sp.]|uniref:efflux RND transporter periplasmic adaptor subunit n=1 Tax=Mizugakiibacter sp. TaxID=1972610 RepID=UPI00320D7541